MPLTWLALGLNKLQDKRPPVTPESPPVTNLDRFPICMSTRKVHGISAYFPPGPSGESPEKKAFYGLREPQSNRPGTGQ
jgi:hypothetical protein